MERRAEIDDQEEQLHCQKREVEVCLNYMLPVQSNADVWHPVHPRWLVADEAAVLPITNQYATRNPVSH